MEEKDIHTVMRILKDEVQGWDPPSVTRIATGTKDPFKVLISCMLSLRTKDEVTRRASERLFNMAPDSRGIARLSTRQIQEAIYPVGFYRIKAKNIKKVCEILIEKYRGDVPSKLEELLSLPGVGRKTANLVLTLGFGKPGICVDTHVHRITNRWGYVNTKSPKDTEFALRKKLPEDYWIEFNSLLVSFGQRICRPIAPFCSECVLQEFCKRVGVKKSR